jgi:hypothetical protein
MELVKTLIVAFTGSAVATLAVGYLFRVLIAHQLGKDLAAHKATLDDANKARELELASNIKSRLADAERQIEHQALMLKYQGPLIHAVYNLQSRLYNIVAQGFVRIYLTSKDAREADYVINNTTFVIMQYFAWTEIIRREIQFLDLAESDKTKDLSTLQDKVYSIWQTDEHSKRFRIWAGDQRALGEVMIEDRNGRSDCMGYAAFLNMLEDKKKHSMIDSLRNDIKSINAHTDEIYPRIIKIQNAMIDILDLLDPKRSRFPESRKKLPSA